MLGAALPVDSLAASGPTSGARDWILLLLIVSFLGKLIGTVTVALSYYKGHRIATTLSGILVPEDRNQVTIAELDASAVAVRNVVEELKVTWPKTHGLVAFVIGAPAGFAARVIALYAL